MQEIQPGYHVSRRHCNVSDFIPPKATDKHSLLTKKNNKKLTRRSTCPNLLPVEQTTFPNVSQKALQSFLTSERQKMFRQQVGQQKWNLESKLSLSHIPIVECRKGESPGESDTEVGILYDRAQQEHFQQVYKQVDANTTCENESSETDTDCEGEPEDLKTTVDSLKTGIVKSQDPKVGRYEETTKPSANNIEKENPSISDFESEEDSEPTQGKTVINSEEVPIAPLTTKAGDIKINGKDSNSGVEGLSTSGISDNEIQMSAKHEDVKDCVKVIDENVKDSVKVIDENGKDSVKVIDEKLISSISSEDEVKRRYYDSLTDDQTETLVKESSFCVHQHKVHVHVEENNGNKEHDDGNGLDTAAAKVANGNTKSDGPRVVTDTDVKKTCSEPQSLDGPGFGAKDLDLNELEVHVNNVDCTDKKPQECEKTTDSECVEKVNKQTEAIEDLTESESDCGNKNPAEALNKKETDQEQVEMFTDDSEKENKNPDDVESVVRHRHSSETPLKYESEIETEDEGFSIANVEPCINCLEIEVTMRELNRNSYPDVVRCEECIEKFKKYKVFGGVTRNKEVIDFGKKSKEKKTYESSNETEVFSDRCESSDNNSGKEATCPEFSNIVNVDSSLSKYWANEIDGLVDLTLYVQCHSDISLFLLLENLERYEESLLQSLVGFYLML